MIRLRVLPSGWRGLVAALVIGSAAAGQVPKTAVARPSLADSSVSALMQLARRGRFPDEAAAEILRQRTQPYSESKRLSLADSIADLAIRLPGTAISAVVAIKQWGVVDPHLRGQADPAALDYLIRISREAQDADTRMGAIAGMAYQVSPARALPYLKEVAASAHHGEALTAVSELQRLGLGGNVGTPDERAAAVSALRQLYDAGAMKSGAAIAHLCAIAAWQHWPGKPMCRGRA